MIDTITQSMKLFRKRTLEIASLGLLFGLFFYNIKQLFFSALNWTGVNVGMFSQYGATHTALTILTMVVSVFATIILGATGLTFFTKHLLDILGGRQMKESDYLIPTVIRDGYNWVMMTLVAYIPVVALVSILLPEGVLISHSVIQLSFIDGLFLALCQIALLVWGLLSAYIVANNDEEKHYTVLIKYAGQVLKKHQFKIVTSVLVANALYLPFVIVPIATGWDSLFFLILYFISGLPLGSLIVGKTLETLSLKEGLSKAKEPIADFLIQEEEKSADHIQADPDLSDQVLNTITNHPEEKMVVESDEESDLPDYHRYLANNYFQEIFHHLEKAHEKDNLSVEEYQALNQTSAYLTRLLNEHDHELTEDALTDFEYAMSQQYLSIPEFSKYNKVDYFSDQAIRYLKDLVNYSQEEHNTPKGREDVSVDKERSELTLEDTRTLQERVEHLSNDALRKIFFELCQAENDKERAKFVKQLSLRINTLNDIELSALLEELGINGEDAVVEVFLTTILANRRDLLNIDLSLFVDELLHAKDQRSRIQIVRGLVTYLGRLGQDELLELVNGWSQTLDSVITGDGEGEEGEAKEVPHNQPTQEEKRYEASLYLNHLLAHANTSIDFQSIQELTKEERRQRSAANALRWLFEALDAFDAGNYEEWVLDHPTAWHIED